MLRIRKIKMKEAPMHYGWIIVWLTFISILLAAGIRSITGIIMIPLEEEFEWSRSAISFAFAVNLTLYGFSGPFFAAGMERFGVRKMMVSAMIVMVIGMLLSLAMTQIWHLILLWGCMIALGSGVFLSVLSAIVANRWFEKRKGLVIGLLMAATATGQMIFLPILSYITELYSWRVALSIFIGLGALMIPFILVLMRDHPSEKGLLPYGMEKEYTVPPETSAKNPVIHAFNGLRIGLRSGPFWLLAISFFICGLSTTGLISTHFIPASTHHGIPEVHAASLLAFMGIFNIIGTLFSGWLSDRFDNRWLLFWYYGLRGLSLLFLPYTLELHSYGLLIAFAVFYGLDWIATVPPTVRLATDHFGKERGAIMYGWIFASHQVGSGAAAYLAGYIYEINQSYTITFLSAGVLSILATIFVLKVKNKRAIEVNVQV